MLLTLQACINLHGSVDIDDFDIFSAWNHGESHDWIRVPTSTYRDDIVGS
jgi:hypothetical protein